MFKTLQKNSIKIVNETNEYTSELQYTNSTEKLSENDLKSEIYVEPKTIEINLIPDINEKDIEVTTQNVQSHKDPDIFPQAKLPIRSLSNELLPSLQALNITSHCNNETCSCRKTNKRHSSVIQLDTPIIKLPRNDQFNPPLLSSLDIFKPKTKLPDFSSFLPKDFDFTKSSTLSRDNFFTTDCNIKFRNSSEPDDIFDDKRNLTNIINNESINVDKSSDAILDLSDIFKSLPSNIGSKSCSQQALTQPNMDDCSISELSAYFDNYCHIPKNMSDMAKMMYT